MKLFLALNCFFDVFNGWIIMKVQLFENVIALCPKLMLVLMKNFCIGASYFLGLRSNRTDLTQNVTNFLELSVKSPEK